MKLNLPRIKKEKENALVIEEKQLKYQFEESKTPAVITFWSPKATGKSMLASVFTAVLSKELAGARICLADFDLFTPNLPSEGMNLNTVAEMIFRGDFDPKRFIKSITPVRDYKNVYHLGGLTDVLSLDQFDNNVMDSLLSALKTEFDYVIVDAGREINLAPTLAALDIADVIIIPVIGRASYIRHVRRFLEFLTKRLCFDAEKIRVVQNMYANGNFTAKETANLLQFPVAGVIRKLNDLEECGLPEVKPDLCYMMLSLTGIQHNKLSAEKGMRLKPKKAGVRILGRGSRFEGRSI
ncbi:AAA family ATPase [Desulfoscipio geothermicus]|uniref:MinD-like ATPase involved in chromosome partitioning or flagellar assembly n=1 Tax=Desulfoscipio geothermicus DSM 3669 TaxID=1121426 RepID=A0A1I6E2B0_9FIRM|nr:hypothetical protein [Desulfoscipio geothermicus]SFR11767.1 MinD-like ATPase involved in chromosome partitioning or flagellar assembly [Desulfoscipio geothermicus DSM 3669]